MKWPNEITIYNAFSGCANKLRKESTALLDACAVIVADVLIFLSWFYLPRDLISWGIRLAPIVFLLVCLVNWWNLAVDYVYAGKPAD